VRRGAPALAPADAADERLAAARRAGLVAAVGPVDGEVLHHVLERVLGSAPLEGRAIEPLAGVRALGHDDGRQRHLC